MDDKRSFKDAIYAELEMVGKAVSSRRRLELLDVLSQGAHTVEQLAKETEMSVANTSQHLQRLKKARLVSTDRDGNSVYYRLADASVAAFVVQLRRLGEQRLPAIDETVESYFGGVPSAKWDDVAGEIEVGQAVLIDTRPPEEYNSGHLPGAISVPADELEKRIDDLPQDKRLVAYCRGPYCTMAAEAVRRLSDAGYEAVTVDMSVPEFHVDERGEIER